MRLSSNHGGHRDRIDRRSKILSSAEHWTRLSTSQRFALYTLAKLGYQLLFVRSQGDRPLAITRQDSRLATIDEWGDINFNPMITLRQ
ncbi:hypothetical protein [Shewanella sp.]|uniref:hypothetical protein n=1 Tax=Shewanella sp. TaxID=50422 RepID=UPI00356A53F8